MCLNKIQQPNGGFEIIIKTAVFLLKNWIYGGCIKVALF